MTRRTILPFPPPQSRVHEVCGPGAFAFVGALAMRLGGKAMWVREGWQRDQINPLGFAELARPGDLLIANAKDQVEVLAIAEEALRSGALALVVMELSKPLGLTEGRRLQLAAKGMETTGLAIIPEGMGSNAAETRWHCAPVFDPGDSTLQEWKLIKNKSGTLGAWYVRWDHASRRFNMVSPAGK